MPKLWLSVLPYRLGLFHATKHTLNFATTTHPS